MEPDPTQAAQLFISSALQANSDEEPTKLQLSVRARDSLVERHREILCFYKRPRLRWATSLQCKLLGKYNYFRKYTNPGSSMMTLHSTPVALTVCVKLLTLVQTCRLVKNC